MRLLFISITFVLGFAYSSTFHAKPAIAQQCLFGCPLGAPTENTVINRSIYTLSNNPNTKFADWVAYRVSQSNLSGPSRRRNWAADPDLDSADTLTPPEYDHSNVTLGVDRGHQAPLAAFKGHDDWAMTNILSNITPQSSKLNQGPWKNLEGAIRNLADNTGQDVFVMTGPLYEWPMAKLPSTDKTHRVPSGYWKIVAIQDGTDVKVAGFYYYQDTPRRANYCDHFKTVDFIEQKSGLNFFSEFSSEINLESAQPTLISELGC